MKHVVLVIPDGVGIRNFVYGNLIDTLQKDSIKVSILHKFSEAEVTILKSSTWQGIQWISMPAYKEGFWERIFRVAKIYAQLYWFFEEDKNWIAIKTRKLGASFSGKLANLLSQFIGNIFGNAAGAQRLDRWHQSQVFKNNLLNDFVTLIKNLQPSVIFCSHQRAPSAVPCMVAGMSLQIPTITFIYSWDNLPKGRMAVKADYYFVWSEHMAGELQKYYPEISETQIKIVGSPQFEPYFDERLKLPRKEFLNSIGVLSDKAIVCYSGCDLYTSPFDQYYLKDIADAIQTIDQAERPILIFRPVPGDNLKRYEEVLSQHPNIILTKPIWEQSLNWANILPFKEDTSLLVNTVAHSDIVINLGSTVSFDFSIYNKPALYINYDNDHVDKNAWSIDYYYQVPHFKMVKKLNPIKWINSKLEIAPRIVESLANPYEKKNEIEVWKKSLLHQPMDKASDRINFEFQRIIHGKKAIK